MRRRNFVGILWRAAARPVLITAMAGFAAGSLALDGALARSLTVHHSFCAEANCTDGEAPGGMIRDGAGNLYGTTSLGGTHGRGTAFKLRFDKNTGEYTHDVLHDFCSEQLEINCTDGAYPTGGLIRDKSGNLYGTTYQGGGVGCATGVYLKGCGVVFALLYNPANRTYTLRRLLTFDGTGTHTRAKSGSASPVGLVMDGDGNLYGSAVGGGANDDYGAVFQLTPLNAEKTRWSHQVLYRFCRQSFCRDGQGVYAPPAIDRLGNLYGTTFEGGANDKGTVFALMLNRSTGKYTFRSIYSFCATCGFNSVNPGQVMADRAGNLFGTTEWDTGEGTLFKLTPNAARTAWTYKIIRKFCSQAGCSDGATPSTNLVMDADGNMFGGTSEGGRADGGTLFQLTPNAAKTAWSYRVLYRFCSQANCADGSSASSLSIDAAGNLFVSTSSGGANDGGAMVELAND